MPPFILIILLIIVGTFFMQTFVFIPLELIGNFNLPSSITIALLALVLMWCFGE